MARELASATGESLTGAVTTALRERLDRLTEQPRADIQARLVRIRKISEDSADRWAEPNRRSDHGDLLYDEHGLPW